MKPARRDLHRTVKWGFCPHCKETQQLRKESAVSPCHTLGKVRRQAMVPAEEFPVQESHSSRGLVTEPSSGRSSGDDNAAMNVRIRPDRSQNAIDRVGKIAVENV